MAMTVADFIQIFNAGNESGVAVASSAGFSSGGAFLAAAVSQDGQQVSQTFSDPSASGGFISVVGNGPGDAVFEHQFFHQFDLLV